MKLGCDFSTHMHAAASSRACNCHPLLMQNSTPQAAWRDQSTSTARAAKSCAAAGAGEDAERCCGAGEDAERCYGGGGGGRECVLISGALSNLSDPIQTNSIPSNLIQSSPILSYRSKVCVDIWCFCFERYITARAVAAPCLGWGGGVCCTLVFAPSNALCESIEARTPVFSPLYPISHQP